MEFPRQDHQVGKGRNDTQIEIAKEREINRAPRLDLFPDMKRCWRSSANRAIRTSKLNALLRLHAWPIDVVVFHGSQAKPGFEVSFPLRCFQRLSRPHLATRLCRWHDNRRTSALSTPVLSY